MTKKMWEIAMKLSILVLAVSLLLSVGNRSREEQKNKELNNTFSNATLEYDFYQDSCPQAEQIVASAIRCFYKEQPNIAPALLRLLFRDCFIQGCDASVLLHPGDISGTKLEKDTFPKQTLEGWNVNYIIRVIKREIEAVCPATVSCADLLVLAAREGVVLAGGPYYPVITGRRDSLVSFPEVAASELPSPHDDLSKTLASFASKGFNERETASLLGAPSIGKGILHADQQLMAGEGTARDFAQAMMKLSSLQVLTKPLGQIRRKCWRVA